MKNLLIDKSEGIVTVTISRPQALNALNIEVLDDLRAVIQQFYDDRNAHGMIITGDGEKSFVAGADIKEFSSIDSSNARAFSERGQQLFKRIEESSKPILAAVNGFALGGGCELAMACHIRIASQNARFGLPEVTLGIIPGYGGTQRLPQLVGRGKAFELILTGEMISADDAKSIGLVNHVTATREELLALANKIMKKIVAHGSIAIANAIKSINAGYGFESKGYEAEAISFASCISTDDFKEGTNAFLQKRKPSFAGK